MNKWSYKFQQKQELGMCWSVFIYLFDPVAPCSYSLPVSAAPAAPFAIPLLVAHSFSASGFGTSFPPSVIFSVTSLCTAVGSFSLFCRSHWFFLSVFFNGCFSFTTKNSLPK
jgi:hypothetical protein